MIKIIQNSKFIIFISLLLSNNDIIIVIIVACNYILKQVFILFLILKKITSLVQTTYKRIKNKFSFNLENKYETMAK